MPIIAAVELFFQVFFAVHAYRNGKGYYWFYIIILFPGVGCLVYFFAEYVPDLQARAPKKKSPLPASATKRLQYLKDQLELTPSVNNKKALAEEYVHRGDYDAAISLYRECLKGVHENDTTLLEGLSLALYLQGNYKQACEHLEKLLEIREPKRSDKFSLLHAMALENLKHTDAALSAYESLLKGFSGEEARVRYGLLLKSLGRATEARTQFETVLNNARLAPKYYRKRQKQWIAIARREAP